MATVVGTDGQYLYYNDDSGVLQKTALSAAPAAANLTPDWINVKSYGAKGDAQKVSDGAGGAGYITSITANFKPSDVGKVIWAVTSDNSGMPLVQSIISAYISPTRVNIASGGVGAYTNLQVIWGTDDTAALQAACAAAIPAFSSGYYNAPMQLSRPSSVVYCPAGGYVFQSVAFDFTTQGYIFLQPSIVGDGPGQTVFYPSLNFTWPSANNGMLIAGGYNGGGTCQDFTVDGSNAVRTGSEAYYWGVDFRGVEVSRVCVTGFNGIGYGAQSAVACVHDCTAVSNNTIGWNFIGGVNCSVLGGLYSNSAPYSAQVTNSDDPNVAATVSFHGTLFDEPGLNVVNSVNVSLHGCTAFGGNPNGCVNIDGTSSVFIFGGSIGAFGAPTNSYGIKIAAGGQCTAAGVYIYGRGNLFAINNAGTFVDGGGNAIVNVTTPANIYTGSGVVAGALSITGVACTAANITPSTSWGTAGTAGAGVSAVSGNTRLIQFMITAAGSPGANPTVTVVFPTSFLTIPICTMLQVGGTNFTDVTNPVASALATGVTFTLSGTPIAGHTYVFQISSDLP